MRRLLSAAFVVAIVTLSFAAHAQVPFVQVYFDEYGTVDSRDCPPVVMSDTLSVFACNFNMWMSTIEYMIGFGPAFTFCGDIFDERVSTVGNSEWGLHVTFRDLGDARGPFRVQRVCVVWHCTDCAEYLDTQIEVLPHPDTGKVRAVSADDVIVDAVGMASTTCPWTTPARKSTWGQVKSLYGH
jgi:hypothetical protein